MLQKPYKIRDWNVSFEEKQGFYCVCLMFYKSVWKIFYLVQMWSFVRKYKGLMEIVKYLTLFVIMLKDYRSENKILKIVYCCSIINKNKKGIKYEISHQK